MKTKKTNLVWKVYVYNRNSKGMEQYNLFENYNFLHSVAEHTRDCEDKEVFADIVSVYLMHYFWAKCEWEIIISPWIAQGQNEERKIDVYEQIMMNWDVFIDYLLKHRKQVYQWHDSID